MKALVVVVGLIVACFAVRTTYMSWYADTHCAIVFGLGPLVCQ